MLWSNDQKGISRKRLIEIFLDLVQINATSKQEKPVANYIQRFLKRLNIPSFTDRAGDIVGGNTGNVIAAINNGSAVQPVALIAHMDTVKPTAGIKPQFYNGMIKTDGTTILGADNRAGVAMILYTVENYIKNKLSYRPFEIIFTIGEETGLYGSSNLDMSMIKSRTAYILDSSASPGSFVYAAPGATEFEIEFIGKGSHAAVQPEKGVNALSMAVDFLQGFRVGRRDEDTTINIGKISGGEANNVVPPQIKLTGEIRSFYQENIDAYYRDMEEGIRKAAIRYKGTYKLESEQAFPGFVLDLESSPIRQLGHIIERMGLKAEPLRYHGGSDANMLNNRGMMAIDIGIGAKNPHSTDEYIEIKDMVTIVNLVDQLLGIN